MNFDVPFLAEVLSTVLLAVISALVIAGANYFLKKTELIQNDAVRENVQSAINTIARGINYTNQTFVDELKREGKFDDAAMKEAFIKTKSIVERQIDADGRAAIEKAHSDFNLFIESEIESQIQENKKYTQPIGPIVTVPVEEFVGAEDAQEYPQAEAQEEVYLVEEVAQPVMHENDVALARESKAESCQE